jgi:N-acetylglucosamine-6-phosphate deacetylase
LGDDRLGQLRVGARADVVVVGDDLVIERVLVAGREV